MFKLISSRQNKIVAKRSSKSSSPVTFSTHRVGKKSDNFFSSEFGACSLTKLINIFCRGSENLKK